VPLDSIERFGLYGTSDDRLPLPHAGWHHIGKSASPFANLPPSKFNLIKLKPIGLVSQPSMLPEYFKNTPKHPSL
jgi:hypothetical protein